jgi:hexosaminidase
MPDDLYANADRTFIGNEITNLNALVGRVHPRLEKPKHILGLQGQVWTETIRTPRQFQEMVFPRLIALAERAWFKADWESATPDKELLNADWSKFVSTIVTKELPKLESAGVHFYLPPPGAMIVDQHLLANSSLPDIIIEYSLDNGKSWREYTKKMLIESKPVWLRTRLSNTLSRAVLLPQQPHK